MYASCGARSIGLDVSLGRSSRIIIIIIVIVMSEILHSCVLNGVISGMEWHCALFFSSLSLFSSQSMLC